MVESNIPEVLIVGAGPVGCVLALRLAYHGVACTVIEQSTEASRHPKMDYLNTRSMELLETLGLADELRQLGVPADQAFNFQWTTGLHGPPVAAWSYWSPDDLREQMATTNDGTLPRAAYQRVIGSRLEEVARQRCRRSPLVDLREGWAFHGLTQDGSGVTVDLTEVSSGRLVQVAARRVVACDGSNSAVRRGAGIGVGVIGPVGQHCNVYFRSADPALVRYGRFFLTISAGGVTLVSRDGHDTWTGSFPLADDEPLPPDPMPLIRERLGVDFVVDEVYSAARWDNRLAVADTYRRGEVFLAGDSAHQYFPAGGYGANTGIGDAVDLGWKLAAVINGWAAADLLDSYEAERRPVALFNREACMNLMEVWRRFMALARNGASPGVLGGYLRHQSYQIRNLGVHLGYRYAASPVVCADDEPEPDWRWQKVVASTWPGVRAPSVRLADGTEIFDALGPEFTLVDFTSEAVGAALMAAARALGIPVTYLSIDDKNVRSIWERDLVLVRPDHHVAWRGDTAPADGQAVLAHVTGRRPSTPDTPHHTATKGTATS